MIRSTLKAATCLAALTALLPSLAFSQEAMEIDVPAQPLATAIAELGRETGLQVGITRALSAGKQSTGVRGVMTARQALAAMLQGTGLQATSLGADGARISQAPTASQLATDDELVADEIIVQGELQSRTLQDTQTSVAVITGEELERRPDVDFFSIIERTPGVSPAEGETQLSIRGIIQDGLGGGNGQTINVTVDGAAVNSLNFLSPTILSNWDLEQVEVLRGPQSTQSGRNALAGAVVVRSKDPVHELEFKARAQLGNGDTMQGSVVANVPLLEDTLALRVAVDRQQADGFITNITTGDDDVDRNANTVVRAGLLFEPTDDFSAVFKFTHSNDQEAQSPATVLAAQFPNSRVIDFDFNESSDINISSYSLNMAYDFGDYFSVESDTNYFFSDGFRTVDGDQGPTVTPAAFFDDDGKNFQQEVRLLYGSDRINAVIGAFYTNFEFENLFVSVLPAFFLIPTAPPGATVNFGLGGEGEVTNYAFFGEAEVEVFDGFRIIAGGRYDVEKASLINTQSISSSDPTVAPFLPPSAITATDSQFSAFLPKAGVVYDFTDNVSLGFTVQRGYRAGGSGRNFLTAQPFDFDPEFT